MLIVRINGRARASTSRVSANHGSRRGRPLYGSPYAAQFYADCYRACQVIPSSRTPPAAATAGSGGGAASSGVATTSAQPPYLSYVPEVALRLSCLGHRIVVRRVTDSKHYWSKSMTNLFCYCVLPGTGIGYVLDPSFKEHFRAGRMSDRYR